MISASSLACLIIFRALIPGLTAAVIGAVLMQRSPGTFQRMDEGRYNPRMCLSGSTHCCYDGKRDQHRNYIHFHGHFSRRCRAFMHPFTNLHPCRTGRICTRCRHSYRGCSALLCGSNRKTYSVSEHHCISERRCICVLHGIPLSLHVCHHGGHPYCPRGGILHIHLPDSAEKMREVGPKKG